MSDVALKDVSAGTVHTAEREEKFLILGCGPAALIAAQTLEKAGIATDGFDIVAKEAKPSEIGGAQFLHRPLFEETKPDATISVCWIGNAPEYAEKVYGRPDISTSFDRLGLYGPEAEIAAWSLIKAYERLWEDYRPGIQERTVDNEVMCEYMESGEYTHIISTIPPNAYCANPAHDFESVPLIIAQHPWDELPMDNFILYNGRAEDSWYRMSTIFGEHSIEIGSGGDPAITDDLRATAEKLGADRYLTGMKPTRTTCDCGFGHPTTKLLRVGRFGTWDRKVLLHQVADQVSTLV